MHIVCSGVKVVWPFKEKKSSRSGYEFDDDDRAYAKEQKKYRMEMRKMDLRLKRQQLRNMQTQAELGIEKSQSGGAGEILKQIKELDALRDYLTPEQQEVVEEGGSGAEALLLQGVLEALKSRNNQPDTEEALKTALKQAKEPRKSGVTSKITDETDAIIEKIPPALRKAIASGKVPKKLAQIQARKIADDQFEKVWKRLNSRKPKK